MKYYAPKGGLPPQSTELQGRAKFTESYAFIPAETFSDIVTSKLPFWHKTRAWIMARPAGVNWTVENSSTHKATFHWIRKRYEAVTGIEAPRPFVTSDKEVEPTQMPDCDGAWATTRFVDPDDVGHDMHVNIVTFKKGGLIPFEETHVMEHGLYVLQGTARYLINQDWYDVEPGDFMWLRAFSPQACVATSDEPFRYLLYKDVNRHPKLSIR